MVHLRAVFPLGRCGLQVSFLAAPEIAGMDLARSAGVDYLGVRERSFGPTFVVVLPDAGNCSSAVPRNFKCRVSENLPVGRAIFLRGLSDAFHLYMVGF
jgi:hypothetical protein